MNAQSMIAVKLLPHRELIQQATNHFRAREGYGPLTARVLVNFIRHRLTSYDKRMDAAHFDQPKQEAFRQAVYTAIARTYAHIPAVVQECERQMRGATTDDLLNKAYRSARAS